jgi:hypothetical protein
MNKFMFPVKNSQFKTSSWTGGVIARCVQVARTKKGVAVRDSKDPTRTTLYYLNEEWEAFIKGCKAGEFDLKK